jgi:hypothetical protein
VLQLVAVGCVFIATKQLEVRNPVIFCAAHIRAYVACTACAGAGSCVFIATELEVR